MEPAFLLDATLLLPQLKYKIIFEKFDSLKVGESFILHNSHDPKPLYHQLKSHRGNRFDWTYLQSGPKVWNVMIKKTR